MWANTDDGEIVHALAHIQLCCDFLLASELHHQILVTGLTLTDWHSQVKLSRDCPSVTSLLLDWNTHDKQYMLVIFR